jgi:hypothetical protein
MILLVGGCLAAEMRWKVADHQDIIWRVAKHSLRRKSVQPR